MASSHWFPIRNPLKLCNWGKSPLRKAFLVTKRPLKAFLGIVTRGGGGGIPLKDSLSKRDSYPFLRPFLQGF